MSATKPATEPTHDAALVNRKESASKRLDGIRVTSPMTLAVLVLIVVTVLAPLGRSKLTAPLGLVLGLCIAALAAAGTLLERKTRNGRIVQSALILGGLAFLVVFPIGRANSTLIDMGLFAVFGIAVIGLNLTQGFAGQVSLSHAAFMGIGAYVSALLNNGAEIAVGPIKATLPNLSFLATIPIAAIVCFVLSALIGFPALRVSGPWLAFVTVAFNGLVVLVLYNEERLTNGTQGVRAVRSDLKILGIDMFEMRNYYYFCLTVLLLVAAAVWWIVRSPWGRSFKAIRDNPGRASSLGVSVPTYTLLAFAIGSTLAGISGALYAPITEYIEPGAFAVAKSFRFLLATVVGGVGTLVGPFFGTAFITFLETRLSFLGESYQIAFAVFVIAMMILSPKGIVGTSRRIRNWFVAKRGA